MEQGIDGAVSPEMQLILAGYAEAARRDTGVEEEKWHWKLGAFFGWIVAGIFGLVLAWLLLTRTPVQAFVQVVQVDDKGTAHPIGLPLDLLTYEPEEGMYLDMLGQWIQAVQWRGTDMTLAQAQWRWAYLHTCKDARIILQHMEDREKPFAVTKTKRGTTVELTSITRTPSPHSYHAVWEQWTTENTQPPRVERWAGTFSVGRMKPRDMDSMLQNRLGLCVAGFDLTPEGNK